MMNSPRISHLLHLVLVLSLLYQLFSWLKSVQTVRNKKLHSVKKKTGNISLESWCPSAECTTASDHKCNLCQEKFLIILALGRTGSTTLTWTLDALPGIQMGGENYGAIAKFTTMMDETVFGKDFVLGADSRMGPWGHAKIKDPTNLHCAAQEYVQAMYPPWSSLDEPDSEVIGFKTVRFLPPDGHSDKHYTQFLTKTFPCARYVINYRSDLDALQKSQRTAFAKGQNLETLQQATLRLKAVAEQLGPDRAYLLDSTEWTTNITKFNNLVRWMGFGPECDFEETLELNTVNQYKNGKVLLDPKKDRSKCRYVGNVSR